MGAPRTLLLAEMGSAGAPTISLSAGVHGDEPAAPWALLSLVRDGLLDARFAYRIWPCLNPSGYVVGTRENAEGDDVNRSFSRGGTTPEARAVITANRDRRFVLTIDLHEDYEAQGAYVFEPLAPGASPRFAPMVVRALDDAGLPVQTLDASFDLGTPPSEEPAYRLERGAVIVDAEAEARLFKGLPASLFHYRRGTSPLTIESPRPRPWEERIATHRVAVTTALAVLASDKER
ncbi:MAG TPA: succinylglutamate desuccinylase/aspartoacylase family protein [Candidatus Sulfotelmatobacter sp.]|nr:succinylglutamate desuccinylase/aspartoacylase family protein [Candidatus Sulfotelmatobacter sp.]